MERVPGRRLACSSEDIGVAQVASRDAQVAHAHRKAALHVCRLAVCKAQVLRRTRHLLCCGGSINSLCGHNRSQTISVSKPSAAQNRASKVLHRSHLLGPHESQAQHCIVRRCKVKHPHMAWHVRPRVLLQCPSNQPSSSCLGVSTESLTKASASPGNMRAAHFSADSTCNNGTSNSDISVQSCWKQVRRPTHLLERTNLSTYSGASWGVAFGL